MVVTTASAVFADALPRLGFGSTIESPRLPFTLSLRTSAARTTFTLCAAWISSTQMSGTNPDDARSAEITLSSPKAMMNLLEVGKEGNKKCREHQRLYPATIVGSARCKRPLFPASQLGGGHGRNVVGGVQPCPTD